MGNGWLEAVARVFERHASYQFADFSLPLIYAVLLVSATCRTFGWAARAAFFPKLVPREKFSNAVTWNRSLFQIRPVLVPSVAGLPLAGPGFPFI